METIIVKPKTEKQLDFLKNLLGNLRWDLDIEYRREKEIPEEDVFYPELEKINLQAEKDKKNGKLIKLNTENIDEFWKQVEEMEV